MEKASIESRDDLDRTVDSSMTSFSGGFSNVSNYDEVEFIGSGAFGEVFKARDQVSGKMIALKKIMVQTKEIGVPTSILREISVLKHLQNFDHPNLVKLLDIYRSENNENKKQFALYLVFEHVDQDISTFIENCPSPGLGMEKIKDLMFQILTGIDFLHSNNIVHRDLKPANILLTNTCKIKIADFGLSRIIQQNKLLTLVVVTLWYRAPEILIQSSYSSPVDVWSCGCIFAELYNRHPLFCGQSENDQLNKILELIGAPSILDWPSKFKLLLSNFAKFEGRHMRTVMPDVCSAGQDLFEKMLIFNPQKRISARDALTHEYFEDCRK